MEKYRSAPSKPALGKGLASLLPSTPPVAPPTVEAAPVEEKKQLNDAVIVGAAPSVSPAIATPESETVGQRHMGISMSPIDEIAPNEFQPRKSFDDETLEELAQSIRANGLIQPLVVRKTLKGYQLIAGERRWRAAKIAGLKLVPIVIRKTTDKETLELALIENIQREELNCMDTALAYYQLIHDFDLKQDDLSGRVGKDRTSIANHLRLLKLPQFAQKFLRDEQLSFGHGKALAGLMDNVPLLEKLAREAYENKWSVRELENQIQAIKQAEEEKKSEHEEAAPSLDPLALRLRNLGRDLSQKFSTKVNIRGNDTKGKITIEYFTRDDLDRVLNHLLEK